MITIQQYLSNPCGTLSIPYHKAKGISVPDGMKIVHERDFDASIGELILEWIQVLPEYRKRGIGRAIVNTLLHRAKEKAAFATVSGKADDPTCPERLYRSCGFVGEDIWHVLRKK